MAESIGRIFNFAPDNSMVVKKREHAIKAVWVFLYFDISSSSFRPTFTLEVPHGT
jgi:hypothetical protein